MFKIKQITPSNFCLKCDGCCRFSQADTVWQPHLLKEEKKDLEDLIRLLDTETGFICASLGMQDNKCKIYARRPFECQLYPFLVNRKENKIFLAVDLKCPFAKENLKTKEFRDYMEYLTKLFKNPSCKNILKNNLQIIQIYPEVINLAELKF